MKVLHMVLTGLSPLLMHNPAGSGQFQAVTEATSKQKVGKKVNPTSEQDAEASRYLLPDGNMGVPAIAVRNCLLNATKGQLINRKSALPFMSGGILMCEEMFPLYRNDKPIKGTQYSLDVRRVVIQGQGIPRARARVELPWELRCTFDYNENIVDIEVVKTIVEIAGQRIGLLDYRVEKKGWFGRFVLKELNVA